MPRLHCKSPEFEGQVYELTESTVTVGRSDENHIQINHPSISSAHAEFRFEGGDYRLVDLNSTNGSRVNDEKTEEAILRNGDVLMLGNILFSYESEVAVEAAPLPDTESKVVLGSNSAAPPSEFKNLAPIKKAKASDSGFPLLLVLGLILALGGVGYLAYAVFLA